MTMTELTRYFTWKHYPIYWFAWLFNSQKLWNKLPDNCSQCKGTRGGVLGNENRVPIFIPGRKFVQDEILIEIPDYNNELLACDYCMADARRKVKEQ